MPAVGAFVSSRSHLSYSSSISISAFSASPLTCALLLAIDFPEHDIDRSQYCRDIGQHMASAEEIHGLQMRKARRPDLAAIWAIGAVGDEIDAELALRRLDGYVYLSGRT